MGTAYLFPRQTPVFGRNGWSGNGLAVPMFLAVLLAPAALTPAQSLPLEPLHGGGQGITGAFEGWFKNPDGTFSILYGYYNRNFKQEVDIPIGPNNRIEPGGPDRGQPTHFLTGRQWGMFTVTVPADFGTNKITWTLSLNGQTASIPAGLDPLWEVSPLLDQASGNTPPVLTFEGGVTAQGPRPITIAMTAAMPLTVSIADDAKLVAGQPRPKGPPMTVTWAKFRGPGAVTFANAKPPVEAGGKTSTTATFSEPGDYVLLVVGNDWSGPGGRGFQCCWTNALVNVSVK